MTAVERGDVTESSSVDLCFEAVYRRFAPGVLGYLRARGVEDPEAVTQEVFIAVLPKIGKIIGGEDGIRTLLFSIAHARAVDQHRVRVRRFPTVEYDPKLDGRSTSSAEEIMLTQADREATVALLAALKTEHREVLLLRIVADLPLEQVAKVMGKSVGSVKQLQRRALLALRSHPNLVEGMFR